MDDVPVNRRCTELRCSSTWWAMNGRRSDVLEPWSIRRFGSP
ncbi:hypothetical protein ACFOLD_11835 [Kocuria carniphila]